MRTTTLYRMLLVAALFVSAQVARGQFAFTNSNSLTPTATHSGCCLVVVDVNNDGLDDIAMIQYKVDGPGYVANIIIFDAAGRPVRSLVRSGTLALSGYWTWDGLDDKGNKLPVGSYIIFTEMFNLQGKKERFKNTIVVARKMK